MKLPSLSIVTQTYNEAPIIETTLRQLVEVGESVSDDLELVVVLSEASSDGTNELVRGLAERDRRIRTVVQPREISGYGQAFRLGLAAATKEYIFQTDADGQFDYQDLVRAVQELPGYDYVHFNRANRKDGWERRVIGRTFYYLIRLTVRRSPPVDFDAAFKLFRRDILDHFELNCRSGVLVPEFVIKANLVGARMRVGATEHRPRLGGEPAWEIRPWWLPVTLPNFRIVFQNLVDLFFLKKEIQSFQRTLRTATAVGR
jgi:dolichol-phosphate mannosyltransferase